MEDKTLDQSLNIGTEIRLFEGCTKHVKIGSIKLIREMRHKLKDIKFIFSYCIGREKKDIGGENYDFPAIEETYKQAFRDVLIEGLTDEEYDKIDEHGIKELDTLLDRFL